VLYDGAEAAIRRAASEVPIAIASGALRMEIVRVLDRGGLTPLFRAIVAAEDTPASKPAPDPYQRAVEMLGVAMGERLNPGDCVAIEDSRWGLASARAAGLRTVAVTTSYPAGELEAELVLPGLGALSIEDLRSLW
jgi:beta-phosphoglucomutase